MADFDIDGARKAGYSDGEIADFLGKEKGFDVQGAVKAGYAPAEIVTHLSKLAPPAGGGRSSVNPPAVRPDGADTTASDDAMRAGDPMGIVAQEQYKAPTVTGSVFDNQDQGGPRMDAPTNDAAVNERALDNARQSNPAIDKSPMYSTGAAREKANALVAKGKVAQDKAEAERTKSSGNTAQDIALNVLGGFGGTVNKAGATISQAVGAEDAEAAFDSAAEMYKKMQADNGGGMLPGKVAGFVGSVAPAIAVGAVLPAAEAYVLLSNAGLFALPAFRDTLKEKLAAGQDFPLALAHASQSFGLNLFLPNIASRGGALLNNAAGKGIIGNAASAAAEGAGFSAATTVLDKGTDLVAGEKNQKDWLDFEDMGTMALGFGAMRGIHGAAGAAARGVSARLDRVGSPSQQFGRALEQDVEAAGFNRAQPANLNPNLRDVAPKAADPVAEIFKTGSVQEAAAAAARAADIPVGEDTAAKLRAARPPRPVEPEGALDERGDADVSRLAADADGRGRGDQPGVLDNAVGTGGAGAPAGLDTRGAEGEAEAGAARVGLPAGDSAAVEPTVIADKVAANHAALKEDAVAVPVEGGYALQLKTRPYSDREKVAEQKEVDRLNKGLAIHSPEMEPAQLLSSAPTPEMAVGRRIGRLLGVKVVFLEDHPSFRGVAESGVAYVTPQTKYPAIAIVGHEVFHAYADQHPESSEALKEQVRAYLNQDRVDERLGGVRGDRSRAEEEAFADLNGAMWMDPKFWAEMRRNDPNTFRKLAYAFMQAVSHATQHLSKFKAADFVSDVDTVRKIIAREMSTLAREENVTRHNPVEAEETGQARGVQTDRAADRNPLKDWLSGLGIDPALKREFAPGLTEQRAAMGRGGSMFRTGGLGLDALAERAAQDGYLARPDANAMYDLMAKAFGGERVAPTFGEGQAESEMQRRVERAQQANEDAARDWSLAPDEVEATGFGKADPEVQAQVRVLVARAEAHNIDGEGILETIARRNPNATTDEYLAAARDALQAAVPPEGEAGARDRGQDSRGQGEEGQGLESYSEGDLRTRAAREEAATRADKAATAEADRRASAESPDSFRLTGSDRAADEAAARGQEPMFSADEPPARKKPVDPRVAELKAILGEFEQKGDLTAAEAAKYRATVRELNGLNYETAKARSVKLAPPGERMSALDDAVYEAAWKDMHAAKDTYLELKDHVAGAGFDADTAVDTILRGKNPAISARRLYDSFADTRAALRAQFGDTIPMYRAVGQQKAKPVENWASTREFASQFGGRIVERRIPVDNVISMVVSRNGKYHEFHVGEPPSRPDFSRKAEPRKPGEVTREEARQMGDLRKKVKVLESLLECLAG